jgi:hypothetical protein
LAVVESDKTNEKTAVKPAIMPRRERVLVTKYRTTTPAIGKRDARTVVMSMER